MTLAAGTRLGPYEILSPLGAGGMGEVYRARDLKLDRQVAIKVLPEALLADPERLGRFEREARVLASLNHPNIAAIYGIDDSTNVKALVLELVEGPTLQDRIESAEISVEEAISIARQIAEALEAAHEKGIIHRDLKPANVKLNREDQVKVLDFGLAKALDPLASTSSPDITHSPTISMGTQDGMILGTAPYMSPEQARGKPADKRADIWAFGVVLYEMLTGKRLFAGETVSDTLAAVLRHEVPFDELPRSTPAALRSLLGRCLERDPKLRLRDIGEARIALDPSSGPRAVPGTPTAAGLEVSSGRRGRWLRACGALLFAALASGITWWTARRSPEPGLTNESQVIRVTADSGLTMDPAVSPTASLLAYASDRGSPNLNIWTQPLPAGQPVQVTHDSADAHEPSFSPDGSRIVFRSERDGGGIYEVPSLGGSERLIAQKGANPRFSPDGRKIAYGTGGRGSAGEVWVVDEAGGVPTRLAPKLDWAEHPIWSPDGAAIGVAGFIRATGTRDLFRIDASSGAVSAMNASAILKRAGITSGTLDAWLPGEIFFSAESGDSSSIWSVGVAADGHRVTGPLRRLTVGTGLDQSPTIASGATGRQLYFASLERRANLYRLPITANSGLASGDPQPLTDDAARDEWPSLSADGKLLLFASNRQSSRGAWLMNLENRQEVPLGAVDSKLVNISPDGQNLVYKTDVSGKSRFVVRPVGGGTAQPIEPDLDWVWDWPRASFLITGGVGADSNRLYACDLATGKLRPLLTGASSRLYGHGRLSPDGRWMSAMEWPSAGRSRIIVFPFRNTPVPPSEWVVVTDEDSVAEENAWSPDGNLLYYVSERDGSRCVWVRRLDPATKNPLGPPTAVLHLHGSRRSMISTADGPARFVLGRDELIFSMQMKRGNIWKIAALRRQ
ncbi:MAG: protein kinase domain-containing protein [Thermoanaerobaculia bacterium]